MMLKGPHLAAGSQAAAPARSSIAVSRRKHAAFKGSRVPLVVSAAAEAESATPAPSAGSSAPRANRAPKREITVDLAAVSAGDAFEGVVSAVEAYGAFVNFGASKDGLVHISQLANKRVNSAADVVKVGDAVTVRVLSVDASTGKIALSMRDEATASAGGDMDMVEEEEIDDTLLPAEGFEFVFADAVADFSFPFQMEEEDTELSVNVVNAFEDTDMEIEAVMDVDVPLNELVTGKVSRVEEYGAFLTVAYGNKEFKAFLERDEAKIPASALSAEELKEFVEEGDPTPHYIDTEFDDMRTYYKVGDSVQAFVLDYNDRGEINLTQYTDVEVEADGFDIEEDDEEKSPAEQEPLSMMGGATTYDVLALDPEDLLEEDAAAGMGDEDPEDMNEALSEYKVYGRRGPLSGALFAKGDMSMAAVNFPDRPLDKLDANAINSIKTTDRDFDGDEIYLEDLWQESIHVPKDALKRLGLKIQFSEAGEAEVVEREGGVVEEEDIELVLSGDHKARVAAFVHDLLDDDEDEAELPVLAMRRPL